MLLRTSLMRITPPGVMRIDVLSVEVCRSVLEGSG